MSEPTKRELVEAIGRIQHLIGIAKAGYESEGESRADDVIPPLEEAFAIAVETRGRFPSDW